MDRSSAQYGRWRTLPCAVTQQLSERDRRLRCRPRAVQAREDVMVTRCPLILGVLPDALLMARHRVRTSRPMPPVPHGHGHCKDGKAEQTTWCSLCGVLTLDAQFISVCRAYNLTETRCTSSPIQSASPAKTLASSRPSRAHGPHPRPSTNGEKWSDNVYRKARAS